MGVKLTDEERFWSKVKKTEYCWEWLGRATRDYGHFKKKGACVVASREAYELSGRHLPKEVHLKHVCNNKICVNPDHMELRLRRKTRG